MPTTNARKQLIPLGTEQSVSRQTIFAAWGNSIRDVVHVANATERAQLVSALNAAGQGPGAARPLVVARADAPGLHRLEYSYDGTNWLPASGEMTFANKAAADSFATANGGLLSVGDECRAAGVRYRWSGTLWYLPTAGMLSNAGTDASGIVKVTHGMGKAPVSVSATIAMSSPVIASRLKAQAGNFTATTFDVLILRNDQSDAPFTGNPVHFYWTAVA